MSVEKPTIQHWDCDLAELLPVGVEEQPFPSSFTTQHTRSCHALDFGRIITPKSMVKEKSLPYVIHAG